MGLMISSRDAPSPPSTETNANLKRCVKTFSSDFIWRIVLRPD